MALKSGFKAQAAAAGLALASTFAPAFAEDQQKPIVIASNEVAAPSPVSSTTPTSPSQANFASAATPQFVAFAAGDAIRWAARNDGVAVSVSLGTQTNVTPQRIVEELSKELVAEGIENFTFYFEQNDVPATLVAFHYGADGGASTGPVFLNGARAAARTSAQQQRYYLAHPELGM